MGSNTGRDRSSDGRAWHRRDGESWLTALVDKPADRVTEQVLGIPVVAFYRATNDDLIIARFINNTWSREVVASAGDVGRYVSLAQDSAGRSL